MLMSVLDEFVVQVTNHQLFIIDEHIRLILRPKPCWIPSKLYWKIVKRLIIIESYSKF